MPPLPLKSGVAVPEAMAPEKSLVDTTANGVSTAMMQVVNYEEDFNADLGPFLERNQIANRGFDYNVAAIMGPQSSGKSTLLNLLFGTSFRTMDAKSGRYQVTQGVWLGRDDTRGIVVMDLEGTDSRERGEDAISFERKSALFALALAEVLIINMWTQDVGRLNASNLSLLKTVMELDLQLFFSGDNAMKNGDTSPRRQGHKTRLLFVLRDHVAAMTPLDRLESLLQTDLDNIWNSIAKPEAAAGTELTDYFDLSFFALPHKILMPDEFGAQAAKLRNEFMEGDMFLDDYRRDVAADGFSTYAEAVWSTIRENKELDIPSQKEMLAHVRCEEIAREATDAAEKRFAPLEKVLADDDMGNTETVPELFQTLRDICDDALNQYDSRAYRYSKEVAKMKGKDLREKIGNECKSLFDAQIIIASQNAIKAFELRLVNRRSTSPKGKRPAPWNNWGTASVQAKAAALELFDKDCATQPLETSAEDGTGDYPLSFAKSSANTARKRLDAALNTELTRATDEVTARANDYCLKTFQDAFKPSLSIVLDQASDDVWERTSEVAAVSWEKTKLKSIDVFGSKGLGLVGENLDILVEDRLKPECLERSIRTIKDLIGDPACLLDRMTKRFDDLFRFSEDGLPRSFGPEENLDELYKSACDGAEKLVELLAEINLSGSLTILPKKERSLYNEEDERVVIQPHTGADLRQKLRRKAGAVLVEARRAQEAAKITTRVPLWLYVLLIVFGWNEIMAVLRSPVLLLLCLIVGPLLYVGYISDTGVVLIPAIKALAAPVIAQAQQMLDQAGAPPAAAQPVLVAQADVPSSATSPSDNADAPNGAVN